VRQEEQTAIDNDAGPNEEEAKPSDREGIDIDPISRSSRFNPQSCNTAPNVFSMMGQRFSETESVEDYMCWAFTAYEFGTDSVYCGSICATVKRVTDEATSVIGHVGFIPSSVAGAAGFKAADRAAEMAMEDFQAVEQPEAAGTIGAEIAGSPLEVVQGFSECTWNSKPLRGKRS